MKKVLSVSILINILVLILIIYLNLTQFMIQKIITLRSEDEAFYIKDLSIIQSNKFVYISHPIRYITKKTDIKNISFSVIDSTGKEIYGETHTTNYDTDINTELLANSGSVIKYKKDIIFKIGYTIDGDSYTYTTINFE